MLGPNPFQKEEIEFIAVTFHSLAATDKREYAPHAYQIYSNCCSELDKETAISQKNILFRQATRCKHKLVYIDALSYADEDISFTMLYFAKRFAKSIMFHSGLPCPILCKFENYPRLSILLL